MNDERFLKDWLRDTTESTADPNAAADELVARISASPQRRRWLPWPAIRRGKTDDTPTNRRNRYMFSPIQTVAAVALALAAGGTMLLVAQDTAPAEIAPSAASGPVEAVPVVFDLDFFEQPSFGERVTLANGSTRTEGAVWVNQIMAASDPRFEGTATSTETVDVHDGVELTISGWRIVNDEGAWQQVPKFGVSQNSAGHRPGPMGDFVFVGEDGYDGLIALVRGISRPLAEVDESTGLVIEPDGAPDFRFEGHILNTSDLPEAPEPWSPPSE